MAPGVLKTFKKQFKQTLSDLLDYISAYNKSLAIDAISYAHRVSNFLLYTTN